MSPNSETVLPPEREVDCPCDTTYHRSVFLDSTGLNERVIACLHCGEVSFIECQTEEPHPNHVICVANRVMPLDEAAKSWLSEWPRRVYSTYNDPPAYLPSTYRAASVEDLSADIASAVEKQRGWTLNEKVRRAGVPDNPPPELPAQLYAYRDAWHAFQWNENTSTHDLVMAVHGPPGSSDSRRAPAATPRYSCRGEGDDSLTDPFGQVEGPLLHLP